MKKKLGYLALPLLVVMVLVYIYRQPLILRATGIRPFVQDRFQGWVAMGAQSAELDQALRRVHDPQGDGPGSWVYELSQIAAGHEQTAIRWEDTGDEKMSVEEYRQAAIFYYLARFPFLSSPAKEKAYQKHIQCYLKTAESFNPPLHLVRIPFEDKEIVAYLRIPPVENPPVVLFTGGVDTWKSDFDLVVEALLKQGLAVMAMDMPGTGESYWSLAPDSDRVLIKAIEYLKGRTDLDGNRLGVLMISFGGYFAVRLALTNPDVKAAVNVGGPVILSFAPEHIKEVPDIMLKTIAHAMHLDKNSPMASMVSKAQSFSLDGLLHHPPNQAHLLSINGDQDHLVPIDDLYVISKLGIPQEEWVYSGDGHCAAGNLKEWSVKAAVWLKNRL